ncbi:velvet factor-domain-containing protein [Pisolithus marmoratus]|nr:velvet factor-domain-containing protein [Pisolithus marmoratus]
MDVASTSYGTIASGYSYERDRTFHDRERLEYELTVRQEPKQARMCGVGSDRRPIDPPPIIQLRVIDKRTRQPPAHPDPEDVDLHYTHSFLQNPYYFMFASLAKPDDDAELHWLKDGKTRCTTGSVVSSLYHLKDTENRNEDAGFFVFPDLSVRTEGSYRLKLSLFEVAGNTVRHCKSIYSQPFYVYTAKKFPGMEESTPLSCSLADQGIKIRIRKDIRVRKRPIASLAAPIDGDKMEENQDDEHGKTTIPANGTGKRPRHNTINTPMSLNTNVHTGDLTTPPSANSGTLSGLPPWPTTTTLDPMLGVASAPGGIELPSPAHSGTPPSSSIPPPPGATYELPKANIPPPPGAHIMAPQATSYDGSGTRQQTAAPSSTSTHAHTRPVQPLTTSHPSTNASQNFSPTGASVPQQTMFPNAPTQRVAYDPPRQGYDQASSRAYDTRGYDQSSSRGYDQTSSRVYDQTSSRTAYDGSHRSGYDPTAAATSTKELLLGFVINTAHTPVEEATRPVEGKDVDIQLAYIEQQCLDGASQAIRHAVKRKAAFNRRVLGSAAREVVFKEGDLVQVYDSMLDMTMVSLRKLLPRWSAPRRVVERIGNSYKVTTLEGFPVGGLVHARRLRLFVPREGSALEEAEEAEQERRNEQAEEDWGGDVDAEGEEE